MDGLTTEDVKYRLKKYGYNEIPEKKGSHPVVIFLKQFHSILIYILITTAIISYIFEHLLDVYVTISVILINASMCYIQEYKAERAIQALKKMMVPTAKVLRNNELLLINARKLVSGDIIILVEGDRIPADARLIRVTKLRIVEVALTGESIPISKDS
jgi:Ca2+-transporting ATPase